MQFYLASNELIRRCLSNKKINLSLSKNKNYEKIILKENKTSQK